MPNTRSRRVTLVWFVALAVGAGAGSCSPPPPLVLEPLAPGVGSTARSELGRPRPGFDPAMERALVVVADGTVRGAAEAERAARRAAVAQEAEAERAVSDRSPARSRPAEARSPAPATPSGPVDLNAATRAELESLPGIGPAMAERIELERPFAAVDDLDRVRGIGPRTLDVLRPLVTVSSVASP